MHTFVNWEMHRKFTVCKKSEKRTPKCRPHGLQFPTGTPKVTLRISVTPSEEMCTSYATGRYRLVNIKSEERCASLATGRYRVVNIKSEESFAVGTIRTYR